MEIQTARPKVRTNRSKQPSGTQTPNEQYDSLEVGVGQRATSALKGFAVGAAIGGGVSAAAGALASLSGPAPVGMLVQVGLGFSAALGAVGAAIGLAGSRTFAQMAHRETVQSHAVQRADEIPAQESPTAQTWKQMAELGAISTTAGLSEEGVPLARKVLESLEQRGAKFVDCDDPGQAILRLKAGKPFTLNLEGQSTISSSQALLAFDVTRGAGTEALPQDLRTMWARCQRSLKTLPGGASGAPRDKMEELVANYSSPETSLKAPNADFKTYSDIEHFDFLEHGGPAPSKPHRAVPFLSGLREKEYQLKQYSFDDSWDYSPFSVYLGMRDNRHDNLLIDTPQGTIPIHLNSRLPETVEGYEKSGLKNLADHFSYLKRFHTFPTDKFHEDRAAEQHWREISNDTGLGGDEPPWYSDEAYEF